MGCKLREEIELWNQHEARCLDMFYTADAPLDTLYYAAYEICGFIVGRLSKLETPDLQDQEREGAIENIELLKKAYFYLVRFK